jgi:aspartate carbamoyltransferase catalytic subunit
MIGRDLLGIEDLERADIERILDTAEHMVEIGEREGHSRNPKPHGGPPWDGEVSASSGTA